MSRTRLEAEIADLARLHGGGALRDALEEVSRSGASENSVRRIMSAIRSAATERARPELFRELGSSAPLAKPKRDTPWPKRKAAPKSEQIIRQLVEKRVEALLAGLLAAQARRRPRSTREAVLAVYADAIITKLLSAMLLADPSLTKKAVLRILQRHGPSRGGGGEQRSVFSSITERACGTRVGVEPGARARLLVVALVVSGDAWTPLA